MATLPKRALVPLQTLGQPSLSPSSIQLGAPAQRALQYYRVNTAKQLSGYFDDDFWTTSVLQVGDRDQCVSYALVALASLHEHFNAEAIGAAHLMAKDPEAACRLAGPDMCSVPMRHALSYYTEAVRRLHTQISTCAGGQIETTLLCCLLLAAFELLRGYHKESQVHLHGSAGLLQAWQDQNAGRGGSIWSPRGYFIREKLGPLFCRMALQASLFGHAQPAPSSSNHGDDGAALAGFISDTHDSKKRTTYDDAGVRIASSAEARDTLYQLIWHMHLLPEGQHHLKGTRTKRARAKGQDNFIRGLHQWQDTLFKYLERQQSSSSVSSTMLKLLYTAARVIIPTFTLYDQMVFDSFATQFREMTDLAEALLFPSSPEPPPPAGHEVSCFFSLDMGVLHLLYHVVIRCRVWSTRHRALALLRRAQARREGVWDGAATALVAGRVVALEEQAARRHSAQIAADGDGDGGGGSSCIPASARVCSVRTDVDLENRTVVLRCGWQRDTWCSEELLTW
ncbi:hypothetical protein CkaCkLH20_08652 [Colletotrichum karsti]|uniref:C6 zinc finger domain protein n=1 Tax=Colletotrichum karsti TaxID=1095194 RepID=A0A9P6HZV2_9PEZI|nr:uncharacterized protein CkaCkLH20_08652 [Colletotrichum karsti]KAF9873918.1 hypothetical protein CkaCkLH20_08652 [Colletotrichum karsti]